MKRLAGNPIAALLILSGGVCWSGTATAGQPPQFWQSSDVVVRVVDLPDNALFQRGYNNYVDLGYHFQPDGSGTWIGYTSNGRREKLDTVRLGMMLAASGRDRLPPVPQRPASTATYLFFAANGLLQMALLLRILVTHHAQNQKNSRRKSRALDWSGMLSRKKKPRGAGQAATTNSAQGGGACVNGPDDEPATTFGQRGLRAAIASSAVFGRRGC